MIKRLIFVLLVALTIALPEAQARRRWVPKATTAAAFNPQTQGTLVNWYDASVLGLSNGASVTTFTDSKTGAPNSLTTTLTAGVYATNSVNTLSTVTFDGSNNGYNTGGSSASTYARTLVWIGVPTNFTVSKYLVAPTGNGGLSLVLDATTGTVTLGQVGGSTFGTSSVALTAGSCNIVVACADSGNWLIEVNGVAAGSGTHAVALSGGRTFCLGVSGASGNRYLGKFCETQIYSSFLGSTDRAGVAVYSHNKWGTP